MSSTALACLLLLAPPAYDPLSRPSRAAAPAPLDLTVRDGDRGREIPVRVRLPLNRGPAPVILFSHGLGGSRAGGAFQAEHWAARGFACVNLQHPGSDEAVWKSVGRFWRMGALKRAASLENFLLRADDVPAALDRLAKWNVEPGHPLFGRLDLKHVGMSGHSFGARTTQAVAGQTAPGAGRRFTDRRIDAAVIFSPSSSDRGASAAAFGSVRVPWLLMTGTADGGEVVARTPESRLTVFPHLPATIDRYQLVLDGAEHSAFADAPLPGDRNPRNPNHRRAILALSTAFWDANLKGDRAAAAWLNGPAAGAILDPADGWTARPAR